MLNPFPILFLAPLAYAVMRIVVGCVLLRLAQHHLRNRVLLKEIFSFSFFPYGTFVIWYLSLIEIIVGLMLVLGFLTQIAALLLILLSLKFIFMHKRFNHPLLPKRLTYLLLFVCGFSLLLTGAGAFAIDLPI